MAVAKHPVIVVTDHQGQTTAVLIENPAVTGLGRSEAEAIAAVERCLAQLARRAPWSVAVSGLREPELIELAVAVRPGYKQEGRRYPCAADVGIRVACVQGRRPTRLRAGFLPLLGAAFDLPEGAALRDLVERATRAALDGLAPRELLEHLAPRRVALAEAAVRIPDRARGGRDDGAPEALASVAEPIDGAARAESRAFERDREVDALAARLRGRRASVLIVGPTGAGKTAVLVEAIRRLDRRPAPGASGGAAARGPAETDGAGDRRQPRFWRTGAAELIAGMRYLGQWEERLERVLAELEALGGTLCVASLLDLIRLGGRGPGDSLAQFLLPYLQHGELRLVAECTAEELDAARRLLPGFADGFEVVHVPPLGAREAAAVLARTAQQARRSRDLEVEGGVPDLVARLYRRFAPYAALPGQAVRFVHDLVEQVERGDPPAGARAERGGPPAGARAEVAARAASGGGAGSRVRAADAIAAFSRETGLPEALLRDDWPLALAEVERALARAVVGQPRAVRAAAELVIAVKAGLNDPERPFGVLLLVGPTGVGKTELAKALARYLYGHGGAEPAGRGDRGGLGGPGGSAQEAPPAPGAPGARAGQPDRLIRLDMSEYATPGAAERLLGARGGEPGELVRRIREQPFAVVLLDEVEKAAPEVFDVLLGAFDEGRLTDAYGRVTSFKSAVILLTSNLGAEREEAFGFGDEPAPDYEGEALRFFRPELLNRIDAVIGFDRLSPEVVRSIARKEVEEVAARDGLSRAGLRLVVDEALIDELARVGFDARYGARPLQRAVEDRLVTPLARFLVERPGLRDRTVRATLDPEGAVRFGVEA